MRQRGVRVQHVLKILAEGVGFEPTVTRKPQRFSRPSHSSALAPLRSGQDYNMPYLDCKRFVQVWDVGVGNPLLQQRAGKGF